ncbi:hypothetical protein JCGZ_17552 [Jatropha curcas]|uniref:Uncharacterized protein n=1 Tax=Jatropha curcas TaxID=180498 RepID=A0A067K3L0_JATCU|nr:hypothetical protein JCGZ_17552 [Jatropha curcas]
MGKGEPTATATSTAVESEENISDCFICCICLDLLFKPIVLSCGHVSCFWCVHNCMNGVRASHCPICRRPYNHFPTICQILHFLLLKMYPVAYKRREEQTLVEEKERGCFSPQLNCSACGSHANQEYDHLKDPEHSSSSSLYSNSCSESCSTRTGEPNGNCKQVSVADVQCIACKQLLFRPVILNCGHGYCESCIVGSSDGMLRCQACQSLHPIGCPKVCLDLDHFVQEHFPREYALRREAVQLKQALSDNENPTYSTGASNKDSLLSSIPKAEHLPQVVNSHLKVHYGVGCDFCGMYPIIGDRYQCKDCVEKIGFDLCGDCYNTRSKLPGRFNQQHTPEHKLKLVPPSYPTLMLRLLNEHLVDASLAIVSYDPSEVPEDEYPDSPLSADADDSTQNSLVAADITEGADNPNDTESGGCVGVEGFSSRAT